MTHESPDRMPTDEHCNGGLDDLLRSANASIAAPDHLPRAVSLRIQRMRRRRRIVAGSFAMFVIALGGSALFAMLRAADPENLPSQLGPRVADRSDSNAEQGHQIALRDAHQAAAERGDVFVRFPAESQVYAHRVETEDPNITIIMIYDRMDVANVKAVESDEDRDTTS